MFRNFREVEEYLSENRIVRKVVLAGAHDDISLKALIRARKNGYVEPVFIGDEEKVRDILVSLDENPDEYEIINEKKEGKCARLAMDMINEKKADFPMKGLMQTATFLMAVQNPFGGIADAEAKLNEFTVFEYPEADRMIVTGDCAVNIFPDLKDKENITRNLIRVARAFGSDEVKVACLSVVEKPDPEIQSSVHARALSEMDWGEKVMVEGPFALDNALDEDAARHKGIDSPVAGKADVLLVPDIHAGNILHKAVHFFGHYRFSSGLLGAKCPIIMNSRTDDEDAKYYSVLSAILLSL
ncbi:MAG: phosphate acyltransferase [Erysipelotrichaceae bacterium]|nr:phosphate acyltransferase [Erysipelotrichaceae bacterium]